MNGKGFFELLKLSFQKWGEDKASRLAAALSYYSVFSLAPLLVIVVAAVGFFYGEAAVEGRLVNEIEGAVGAEAASMIQTMIANARQSGGGVIATIASIVLLLFGATNLFSQLQEALNVVWNVQPKPGIGIAGMVRMRLGAFLLVIGVILLLVASLVATALLAALGDLMAGLFPGANILFTVVNWLLSLVIFAALFALIFKILPDVRLSWGDVFPGALFTALLFVIGKELIGLYMGQAAIGSAYGAAGSLVVLLLWIFYTAQIFLFGAVFTHLHIQQRGVEVQPDAIAVQLTERERIQQGMPRNETIQASLRPVEGPAAPPMRTEQRSRSHYLQEEDIPGLLARPRSPAQKSMAALAAILVALLGFSGAAFFRSRKS
jgi:membrane protein